MIWYSCRTWDVREGSKWGHSVPIATQGNNRLIHVPCSSAKYATFLSPIRSRGPSEACLKLSNSTVSHRILETPLFSRLKNATFAPPPAVYGPQRSAACWQCVWPGATDKIVIDIWRVLAAAALLFLMEELHIMCCDNSEVLGGRPLSQYPQWLGREPIKTGKDLGTISQTQIKHSPGLKSTFNWDSPLRNIFLSGTRLNLGPGNNPLKAWIHHSLPNS